MLNVLQRAKSLSLKQSVTIADLEMSTSLGKKVLYDEKIRTFCNTMVKEDVESRVTEDMYAGIGRYSSKMELFLEYMRSDEKRGQSTKW